MGGGGANRDANGRSDQQQPLRSPGPRCRPPTFPGPRSPTAGPLPRSGSRRRRQPGGEPHGRAAAPEPQPHRLLLVDWPQPAGGLLLASRPPGMEGGADTHPGASCVQVWRTHAHLQSRGPQDPSRGLFTHSANFRPVPPSRKPLSGGGPRPGGQAGRGCRVLMVGPWQVWHRPGLCPQLAAWTPAAERPAPLPPSVWSEAIQPPGRCAPPHRLGAERATPPRGRDDGWRPSPRPRTPPGPSTEEGLGAAAGRLVSMPRQPRPGSSGVLPTPPAAPFPGVWPQPRPAARPRGQLSPGPAPARPDSAVPLQPLLSLDHWVTTRFAGAGDVRVTVQAACGSSVLQDSKVVRVLGESPGGGPPARDRSPTHLCSGGPALTGDVHRVPRRRDRPPAGSGLIVALITTHFALRTAPPGAEAGGQAGGGTALGRSPPTALTSGRGAGSRVAVSLTCA